MNEGIVDCVESFGNECHKQKDKICVCTIEVVNINMYLYVWPTSFYIYYTNFMARKYIVPFFYILVTAATNKVV